MARLHICLLLLLCLLTAQAQELPQAVEPLLTSQWGQREPYNYMCPLAEPTPWGGYDPQGDHCRVGCVAVAIGQIMRYHQWPRQGEGQASVSYPLLSSNSNTFTVDFAQATYDYEAMLDDYSATTYTYREGYAVAELLYHAAVASQMIFGQTASATTNFATADALSQHFRYDGSKISTIFRAQHTRQEWTDILRSEIAAGRPVFYEAVELSLRRGVYAHSFVIDGYDATGRFHVNWGWNGHEDGYYDIDNLNPGTYAFNFYQDATIGIERPSQADAIATAVSPTTPPQTYALDGRPVSNPRRGIYIMGGRKVVVR